MLPKIFWTVVAADAVAALVLWKLFERGTHGILVLAFYLTLAAVAIAVLAFQLARSESFRLASFLFLLLPSALLIFYSSAGAYNAVRSEAQFSGTAYFSGPALALAQAMVRHDNEAVQQLIPAAGDLNRPHGEGLSLWQFAVLQTEESERSIEMLRMLIRAGADPKRDTSPDTLFRAVRSGPLMAEFLLSAGVNPNLIDRADQRPVWWRVVDNDDEPSLAMLQLVLRHGADLKWREPGGRSALGFAVHNRRWQAACMLIAHGADWKNEKTEGGTVPELLEWEIIRLDEYEIPVPDALRKTLAGWQGKPVMAPRKRAPDEIKVPDLIRDARFDTLAQTRAALTRLAGQRPDWARGVAAFLDPHCIQDDRHHAAFVLSLQPQGLPDDVQERCWRVVREQVAWYDRNAAAGGSKDPAGWLLLDATVIAHGLNSLGPVHDSHSEVLSALRARVQKCRDAKDPAAARFFDLGQ